MTADTPSISGTETPPTRIAFLNTHPIQYKAPLYAYLNQAPDLDVSALYMSDVSIRGEVDPGFKQGVQWDVDLLEGYHAVFLDPAMKRRQIKGFFSLTTPGVWNEVRSGRYDALIIHGHNFAAHHIALSAARSIGLPVFARCETHNSLARAGLKARLRRPVMSSFYRMFNGFLAIGTANAEFYVAMGVPDSKIFVVPYTVDNERFARMSKMTNEERSGLRARWGVNDNRPVVLFAAKYQPRKRPGDLVRACGQLIREGLQLHLLMVGSGAMETELRALAASELPTNAATFTGFLNQRELPRAYGACEVYVLPSTNEPWGLAINEAMASGLPIVASREIGAVRDIVRDGETGRVFNAGDIRGLAAAVRDVIVQPERRRSMATASKDLISRWSFAECLNGMRVALASVLREDTSYLRRRA